MTVLGELTSGTCFFTSVLEINVRHAAGRANTIVDRLGAIESRSAEVDLFRLSA